MTEAYLRDNMKNGAVRSIGIIQAPSGNYYVTARLTWKPVDLAIVTVKKSVREWTSLDRLVRHINSRYGIPPSIYLTLNAQESRP